LSENNQLQFGLLDYGGVHVRLPKSITYADGI
jgi:hypothetical protein